MSRLRGGHPVAQGRPLAAASPGHRNGRATQSAWLGALFIALFLTHLYWWPLWLGGGFVGGDLYPYYFPQKQFLADSLRDGVWPWWNPLTGHGYPVLGESQTGACYPLHLVFYRLCDVPTAWNAVHLLHYVAAWLAMGLFARRCGLQTWGVLLAATVYVYGWFPARACLEWAILGGVYLPLTLWCVEGWLQTRRAAFLWGLGAAVGLQLLGGHYQLAFYTWLVLALYVPARVAWLSDWKPGFSESRASWSGDSALRHREGEAPPEPLRGRSTVVPQRLGGSLALPTNVPDTADREARLSEKPGFVLLVLCATIVGGIALGGVQLLPTWELQQRSQRTEDGKDLDPSSGHIPPLYLSQLVVPWHWYAPGRDLDGELTRLRWGALKSLTNRVEAHLYVGQAPFYLAVIGLLMMLWRRRLDRWSALWWGIVLLTTLVAIGWFQPLLLHVPGFNFFRGLGRIGVVITLGWGLLAGRAFDQLLGITPIPLRRLLAVGLLGLTIVDLAWWPATINYAVVVPNPPIRARDRSPLRAQLQAEPQQPVRLYAPGANIANLLGVSATPVYLGLGPREYFDPQFTLPPAETDDFHAFTPQREQWLRAAGVTHILCFEPLESRGWSVERVWVGMDPLLNPAWARFQEPLYLYRLRNAPGRAYWEGTLSTAGIAVSETHAHRTTLAVNATTAGRLVLADLSYPGWQVAVDGQAVTAPPVSGMFRAVDVPAGKHTVVWSYRPRAVYWGAALSGLGVVWLACVTWWVGRRRRTSHGLL